jgi:hypothetical protein
MRIDEADAIKVAVVATAVPRWTGALLAAEGVPLPAGWLEWWRILSAILSVGMAITEAFAISYILNAWRVQHDKGSRWLILMATITLFIFTLVLAPYIAANVRQMELRDVLGDGLLWWMWSAAVAASTGVTVLAVGYAQKRRPATTPRATSAGSAPAGADDATTADGDKATVEDWRTIYRASNGDYRQVDADGVREAVELAGYVAPSDSTLRNWAREARGEN